MKIKAAITWAKDAPFSIEDVELCNICADEVLVELVGTGICHTDLAIVHQVFPLPLPYILGHEGAGTVVQVGSEVTDLAVGDRVVLTFESCGSCGQCTSDHPAYCEHYAQRNYGRFRPDGTPYVIAANGEGVPARYLGQSAFATHVVATSRNAVKVTAEVELPLLCGMGCGFMTGAAAVQSLGDVGPGNSLVVTGAGALGFAAMFMAVERGFDQVIMVDRVASRLALALSLGATAAINTAEADLGAALEELGGVDHCIDTTGVGAVVEAAASALKRLGSITLLGASAQRTATLDLVSLIQGKQIRGQIFGDADPQRIIPQLVDLYRAGRFPVDKLIRFYPFADINVAAADAASGATIKPVILFDPQAASYPPGQG